MQGPIAAHSARGSRPANLYRTPLKATTAQPGMTTTQVLTVVLMGLSLILFAFGENLLSHFLSGA